MPWYGPGRAIEGQVRRPVWRDGRAVRQEFPRVVKDHDAIAEQAPTLLGMADNSVRRFAVRGGCLRTGRRVWAHISASWLVHRACSRTFSSVRAALAIAIWLRRIAFSLAICSLPLVSA